MKRGWLLLVGLALASVVFWSTADFFHVEDGIETDPNGCPICHLERVVGSGAPAAAAVTLVCPAVVVPLPAQAAIHVAPTDDAIAAWVPRGPPPSPHS